jgi:rhamnose utilization protein RhaD (predicted bifunctional aldolase and dehydrogenase)
MAIEALQELVRLSARLGADPRLIQGAGGNTSIKTGNTLWVKASGKWLAAQARADFRGRESREGSPPRRSR